jgi:hypothetical protein
MNGGIRLLSYPCLTVIDMTNGKPRKRKGLNMEEPVRSAGMRQLYSKLSKVSARKD